MQTHTIYLKCSKCKRIAEPYHCTLLLDDGTVEVSTKCPACGTKESHLLKFNPTPVSQHNGIPFTIEGQDIHEFFDKLEKEQV